MGFSAGLVAYPKYKDTTYQDMQVISSLISYETNLWAKEKFTTPEEYAKYIHEEKYSEQPQDRVDFYRAHLTPDEYDCEHIWEDYGYWGSIGTIIHNYIVDNDLGEVQNDTARILSKEDIAQLMNYCLKAILKYAPQPCEISRAYKYQRDENGEIPEDADITLFNIDGFEINYEDDEGKSLTRMDTLPEWGCLVGFPIKYMDAWEYDGYVAGLKACANILGNVDFNKEIVVYSGGW